MTNGRLGVVVGLLAKLLLKALHLGNRCDPEQLVISLQESNPAAATTDIEFRFPQTRHKF